MGKRFCTKKINKMGYMNHIDYLSTRIKRLLIRISQLCNSVREQRKRIKHYQRVVIIYENTIINQRKQLRKEKEKS